MSWMELELQWNGRGGQEDRVVVVFYVADRATGQENVPKPGKKAWTCEVDDVSGVVNLVTWPSTVGTRRTENMGIVQEER